MIELRIYHPIIAVLTGIYLFVLSLTAILQRPALNVRRFAGSILVLVFIQLLAGVLNVVLLAPVWMQIVHLFLADMIWIVFILLSAETFSAATVRYGATDPRQSYQPDKTARQGVSFDLNQAGEAADGRK